MKLQNPENSNPDDSGIHLPVQKALLAVCSSFYPLPIDDATQIPDMDLLLECVEGTATQDRINTIMHNLRYKTWQTALSSINTIIQIEPIQEWLHWLRAYVPSNESKRPQSQIPLDSLHISEDGEMLFHKFISHNDIRNTNEWDIPPFKNPVIEFSSDGSGLTIRQQLGKLSENGLADLKVVLHEDGETNMYLLRFKFDLIEPTENRENYWYKDIEFRDIIGNVYPCVSGKSCMRS